jgi:5-methylcytosine-specific restriction protein A
MPFAPARPCRISGCAELTRDRDGYCQGHRKAFRSTQDRHRGSAASRGYDRTWRKLRLAFITEHPLCRLCAEAGLIVAGQVVDHITPHRGVEALRLARDNLQTLCKPCHDRKTATEDGAFQTQGGSKTSDRSSRRPGAYPSARDGEKEKIGKSGESVRPGHG